MSKGQAELVEYIMTIAIGLIILTVISTLSYGFYRNAVKADLEKGLTELTIQTDENILKLYKTGKTSKAQPSNSSSILISDVNLNLPSQISKRNYEIYLVGSNPVWLNLINFTLNEQNVSSVTKISGAKVVARTTQDPYVTVERNMPNIEVGVQGRSENGKDSKLTYYRYNANGTVYDKIVLGSSILIDVTNIS